MEPTRKRPARISRMDRHMRADIANPMRCKAVATHGWWQQSKGAPIEVKVGKSLGMGVRQFDAWIPHPTIRNTQKK